MPDRHTDAAAVPAPDAGDDTLREMARTITAHVRLGGTTRCSCGEIWQPLHVADALLPLIREHAAAAVQGERERIERALPEAIATRVTWGDGMEFISVADVARIVREDPTDG